ncbi:hypothetical protein HK100_010577, partial [Physocladia obscura]
GLADVLLARLVFAPSDDPAAKPISFSLAKTQQNIPSRVVSVPNQQLQQQPPRPFHANAAPPQPQSRPSISRSLQLQDHRGSLASNNSNSFEKNQSILAAASNPSRHSSVLDNNRSSLQSLGNPPNDVRSSVTSETFFRDSLVSKHGSVVSRNSNRFSISSRRGSAMVTVDLSRRNSTEGLGNIDNVPPAPVTQFAAGGPIKSTNAIEEEDDDDDANAEEGDVKKRNRNFVINGLASEFDGLNLQQYQSANPPTNGNSQSGSRRGSEATHHFPARSSSKNPHHTDQNAAKLLAQEIDAYFNDENSGLKAPTGEARNVMGSKLSHSSLKDRGTDVAGRSSSLGWRRE